MTNDNRNDNVVDARRRWFNADTGLSESEMREQLSRAAIDHARRRQEFLAAWKRGIALAGEQYFRVTAPSLEGATDKNQLQPDWDRIKDAIGLVSGGQGAFLAALYSFYNGEDGQRLLVAAGYPTLADLAAKLDPEHADVIAALFVNYQGW